MKPFQHKLRATAEYQLDRTPDIFDSPNIIEKKFISSVKHYERFCFRWKPEDSRSFEPVQSTTPERSDWLKDLDFILQNESDLSSITAESRPKRPNRRVRKARKKTVGNFLRS